MSDVAVERDGDVLVIFAPAGKSSTWFSADGHLPRLVELRLPDTGVYDWPEPIRLVAGMALSGRVVDADDKGIANAVVAMERLDATEGVPALDVAVMNTNAEGRYQVDTVPAGRYRLHAFAPGFAACETVVSVHGLAEIPAIKLARFTGPRGRVDSARAVKDRLAAVTTTNLTDAPLIDALDGLEAALGVRVRGDGDWATIEERDVRLNLQVDAIPLSYVFRIIAEFMDLESDEDGRLTPPK